MKCVIRQPLKLKGDEDSRHFLVSGLGCVQLPRLENQPGRGENTLTGTSGPSAVGDEYSCGTGGNNSRNFRSWRASREPGSSHSVGVCRHFQSAPPPRTEGRDRRATEQGQGARILGFPRSDQQSRRLYAPGRRNVMVKIPGISGNMLLTECR